MNAPVLLQCTLRDYVPCSNLDRRERVFRSRRRHSANAVVAPNLGILYGCNLAQDGDCLALRFGEGLPIDGRRDQRLERGVDGFPECAEAIDEFRYQPSVNLVHSGSLALGTRDALSNDKCSRSILSCNLEQGHFHFAEGAQGHKVDFSDLPLVLFKETRRRASNRAYTGKGRAGGEASVMRLPFGSRTSNNRP